MRKLNMKYMKYMLIISLSFAVTSSIKAEWTLDLEGGLAYSGYNDVRIPGNTGTNISLSEDLKAEKTNYFRIKYSLKIGERHYLSALYAPFQFESSGSVNRFVNFNGVTFDPGKTLQSLYRFDSYRITYQYRLFKNEQFNGTIGFTGKIRDASIKIDDGSKYSEKTNTGFVPLIYFAFSWKFYNNTGFLIEGDALAAPQGRAEDILLAIYSNFSDNLRIRVGYRVLEGGADNDEVYTFALVNYLSFGIALTY